MDYSIAIGIDKYLDTKLTDTDYAENDAKKYSSIMGVGFELGENKLLLGSQATKNEIENNIINMPVIEGDRVFLFFAGHGVNFYNDPLLSCYDSEGNVNEKPLTWLSIKKVLGVFAEKRVNIVCFVDACQSSINYISRGVEQSIEEINIDRNYYYVFSSADYDEDAVSDRKYMHGIWSKYLFDALEGEEGALLNGKLTNNSLQNFLSLKMQEFCNQEGENLNQTPQAWGKIGEEFVIKDFTTNRGKISKMQIKNIYFGTVDADNEIQEKPEKFISNYFDLNDVSHNLFEKDNIQFVVGRKGTGKTYIGKYMEKVKPEQIEYLGMDNFDYKAFNALASKGEGYEPYILPWKYFILAKLLVHVNEYIKNEEIDSVLKELYGRRPTNGQIVQTKFKKGISFKNFALIDKWKNDLAKDNNYFDLGDIVQIFSFLIEDYVEQKYLLILDGLDEKLNENNHYKDIMNGLLWAVKGLNSEMYESKIKIKVAVFFRKDVFEFVQGANTAKLANGSTIGLDWVTDSDDKKTYPLYQFMNLRYRNCLEDFGFDNNCEITDILPPFMKIGKECIDTWEWILNFTTYKPRDVVKMLDECQKKCNKGETRLTQEIIWEAQPEYSKYLLSELKNELYGFVEDNMIWCIFEQLQSMRMGWKDYSFVKTIVNKAAITCKLETTDEYVKMVICKMYEVGILGVMLPNEHEHWAYRRYLNISSYIEHSKFKLHQGLWKALSIW